MEISSSYTVLLECVTNSLYKFLHKQSLNIKDTYMAYSMKLGQKVWHRVKISKWLNSISNVCFSYFNYHTSTKKSHFCTGRYRISVIVVCCSRVKAKITMLHGHHFWLVFSTLNILSMIWPSKILFTCVLPLQIHIILPLMQS